VTKALFTLLSLLPPVMSGWLAWFIGSRSGSVNAPVIGLWTAAIASAAFALRVLVPLHLEMLRPNRRMFIELSLVLLPIFVAAVAAGALAAGWGVGVAAIETRRVVRHEEGVGTALLHGVPPLVLAAALLGLALWWRRPSPVQWIWKLAARSESSPRARAKLAALYRAAARQRDMTTLQALAGAPGMTPDVLELLAADGDVGVRAIVANNSTTSLDLMKRLARDPALEVRRALGLNGAVTVELLEELATGPEEDLRKLARQRMVELGATTTAAAAGTPLTPP
jgi:hypothetical protein